MLHKIRNLLRDGLKYIKSVFPKVKLVWIDIVQRRVWRSGLTKSMEKKRKRVNRFGHLEVLKLAGDVMVIDVTHQTPGFYRADGCHLSDVGIAMYIDKLRDTINDLIQDV